MKNTVYTYNSELGDAFMNLYKKIHKIEKKTTTEEKIRIYTGITAVMPDELLEIKRVIDKMQDHTISMLDLAFNNETPMSPSYAMHVNDVKNAIDDMNAVAELFNFIRKKNNLPTDVDSPIPMSIIGELKSAFENHDFELFEKIAVSNEYELGKMFTPPFMSPFDDLVKPCDTPATVEQLDDVFNDVEPIEPVMPEERITKDEKKPAEEVSEEPEELVDPNIVMAYPRDPEQINIIMNYLDAGFEVNGESITLIRKINKKYKTNITLNAIAFLNQSYLDNAKFSANINIKNIRYAENIFRMDSMNDDGTIDGPLPTTPNLSEEVLRYICDNLQGTRLCTKHGLVSCVKYEFGIEDINTWEVGAISYVMLNILGNKYITDDGNLDPAIKEYRKFFNIPKSEEPINESSESNEDEDVHELNDSVKESNIESSEESKEVLDPAVVMAYPTDMSVMINLIDELIAGFNTQSDDFINVLSKVNNKYKSNITFGAAYIMMQQYNDNLNLTIDPSISMDTVYNICSEVFKLDNLNFYDNTDDSIPVESLSISDEVIGYICKQLLNVSHYHYITKYMIVRLVKNEFGIDVNIWEVAAISYVLINMLGGKYTINEGAALHPLMKNYRKLFNIPKSEEPSTVKSRRRKKKGV